MIFLPKEAWHMKCFVAYFSWNPPPLFYAFIPKKML